MSETDNLIDLARAVRESSLSRLRSVPEGFENWRPTERQMSFADIAHHLIEADRWLFRMIETGNEKPIHGQAGAVKVSSRAQYAKLLEELEQTGQDRESLLERLREDGLRRMVNDLRFGGKTLVWWVVVRGNLDHETHHRGQVAAYLGMVV